EFKFFSPSKTGYVDETSLLGMNRNVVFCVRVDAISPPPEDTKLLLFKCFSEAPAIYLPYEKLEPVLREWLTLLRGREVPEENIRSHSFGLLIRAFVINVTSNEVLYDIVDSIPITLGDFMTPRTIQYTFFARKNVHQLSYVKKTASTVPVIAVTSFESSYEGTYFDYCSPIGEGVELCYDLIAEVKPETLQPYLPSSYFRQENNRLYVKTPVLIAENPLSYSGVVSASIAIDVRNEVIETKLTFAPGNIISSLRNGVYPLVNFELGGRTWGGTNYYYGRTLILDPQQSGWAYMWARPIQQYWQIYLCVFGDCSLIRDEVDSFITDVLIYGTTIQGGDESGLPHPAIMENFYSGTNVTRPYISGTPLDDGDLDPGESVALQQIIRHYDACGSGFEVGVPVGALAAIVVCSALGLGGPACGVAVAFASAFEVSLDFEPQSIYIAGVLQNHGARGGIGYNVTEYVDTRISRYKYQQPPPWWCPWCPPCRYDVPAGIYFKFQ
ncbi:MAG: hypothetical protein ACP5KB_06155, partial [Thermoprotei archaeon]